MPKNGLQRNGRAPRQLAGHRLAVDRDDAAAEFRIILGQRAAQRTDQVPAPVHRELDRLDADLERVARLRAAYGDRPGQDVRTRRGFELLADLAMVRQHDRGVADVGQAARNGVDRHRVAGIDREARRDFRVEVSPVDGGRRRSRACALPWQSSSSSSDHLRARHSEMLIENLRLASRARPGCLETRTAPTTGRRPRRRPTAPARGSARPAGWRGRGVRSRRMISCTCSTRRGDEALRRLVHQDQLGIGHQRAADRQHLLLAAAERAARMVDPLGELRKLLQHLVEVPALCRSAPAVRARAAAPARSSAAAGSRARSAI